MPTAKAIVTDTTGPAIFMAWLDEQIKADGHSVRAIADASGVFYSVLYRARINPDKPLGEQSVRMLAAFFGGDPDEWSGRAGYTDINALAPDPDDFDDPTLVADWLRATLAVRRESPGHASLAMGLTREAMRQVLEHGVVPNRPTLDKMGEYFRVPAAKLRAMRSKHPGRVAAGVANFQRLDVETQERVKGNLTGQTTEDHRRIGRLGGAVSGAKFRRSRTPDDWRNLGGKDKGKARRLELIQVWGSRFKSAETRRLFIERLRAAPDRGKHISETLRARGVGAWLGSRQARDLLSLRHKVARFGTQAVKQRFHEQYRAELRRLARNSLGKPKGAGRPPTLLDRDLALAPEAYRLATEEHLSSRDIAERLGLPLADRRHEARPLGQEGDERTLTLKYRDARGNLGTHEGVAYLVQLERARLGISTETAPRVHRKKSL